MFRLALLSLAAAGAAHAQTPACEMLKSTLSARIPPAIRGFSMEALPAKAPVPPGGKVIGNCEGGAYKVVYSRFGGAAAAASGPTAEASPPVAASVATTPPPAPAPRPAPSPRATPPAVVAAVPDPAPAPRPTPMEPTPARQPSQPAEPVHTSTVAAATPITSDITSPPPTAEPPPGDASATAPEGPGFLATHWPWFAAALALPLLAALWAWLAHHRAYDAAGLPRGPKLN